jgi:hypothetical protein
MFVSKDHSGCLIVTATNLFVTVNRADSFLEVAAT